MDNSELSLIYPPCFQRNELVSAMGDLYSQFQNFRVFRAQIFRIPGFWQKKNQEQNQNQHLKMKPLYYADDRQQYNIPGVPSHPFYIRNIKRNASRDGQRVKRCFCYRTNHNPIPEWNLPVLSLDFLLLLNSY